MGGKRSGGHNRKPKAIREAEGNPGHRDINQAEPVPPDQLPVMPSGMSPQAQRFWAELLPIVTSMEVMTCADAVALGELCMALDRRMQAEEMIQKFTILIPQKNELGVVIGVKTNPAVRVASDADRHVRGYLAAFGLDPASRAGLKVAAPKNGGKVSALDAILRAKSSHDDVVN
jgi:P27 family predicted phage terminase small subunit